MESCICGEDKKTTSFITPANNILANHRLKYSLIGQLVPYSGKDNTDVQIF